MGERGGREMSGQREERSIQKEKCVGRGGEKDEEEEEETGGHRGRSKWGGGVGEGGNEK